MTWVVGDIIFLFCLMHYVVVNVTYVFSVGFYITLKVEKFYSNISEILIREI